MHARCINEAVRIYIVGKRTQQRGCRLRSQRRAVGQPVKLCDIVKRGGVGQRVGLAVIDHLQAVFDLPQRLRDAGLQLHLSEVKGPVMDKLQRSDFLQRLSGRVFLTHHQAAVSLAPADD